MCWLLPAQFAMPSCCLACACRAMADLLVAAVQEAARDALRPPRGSGARQQQAQQQQQLQQEEQQAEPLPPPMFPGNWESPNPTCHLGVRLLLHWQPGSRGLLGATLRVRRLLTCTPAAPTKPHPLPAPRRPPSSRRWCGPRGLPGRPKTPMPPAWTHKSGPGLGAPPGRTPCSSSARCCRRRAPAPASTWATCPAGGRWAARRWSAWAGAAAGAW